MGEGVRERKRRVCLCVRESEKSRVPATSESLTSSTCARTCISRTNELMHGMDGMPTCLYTGSYDALALGTGVPHSPVLSSFWFWPLLFHRFSSALGIMRTLWAGTMM